MKARKPRLGCAPRSRPAARALHPVSPLSSEAVREGMAQNVPVLLCACASAIADIAGHRYE